MSEPKKRRRMVSRAGMIHDPRRAERNLWASSLSQTIGEMLLYLEMPQTDVGGNTAGYESTYGHEALRCLFGADEFYLQKVCSVLDLETVVLRERVAKLCRMTVPTLKSLASEPMRMAA